MTLDKEVDRHRKTIRTDGYPMSIGELASMYADGEIDLHPEFQRYFRWSPEQKSRLIESLLLGIPIPSIFVHQRSDGVWDVVDGLQRVSTIFEAMGILKKENGRLHPPLTLTGTKYLPSLENKAWGANEADPKGIGGTNQRIIKRAKLDVKIVLRESDEETKFELFQRLNTGGSPLSAQELRNCLIIMVDPDAHQWLRDLATHSGFQTTLALSDRASEEQYDVELAVRFVALRALAPTRISQIRDLSAFLDQEILDRLTSSNFDGDSEKRAFESTFNVLAATLDDKSFRRYNHQKDRFEGGFLVSSFEVLALGLGYHFENPAYAPPDIIEIAKTLWRNEQFIKGIGSGVRAPDRLRVTLPLGRKLFAP